MSAERIEEIERLLRMSGTAVDNTALKDELQRLQTEQANARYAQENPRGAAAKASAPVAGGRAPVEKPVDYETARTAMQDAVGVVRDAVSSLPSPVTPAVAPPPTPAPPPPPEPPPAPATAPPPAQPTEAEQAQDTIREVGRLENLAGMVEGAGNIGRALAGVAPGAKTGEAFRDQGKRLVAERATLELDPNSEVSQREARLIEDAMPYMKGRLVGKYSAKQLRGNDLFVKVLAASGKAEPAYDLEGVRRVLLADPNVQKNPGLLAAVKGASSKEGLETAAKTAAQWGISARAAENIMVAWSNANRQQSAATGAVTGEASKQVAGVPKMFRGVLPAEEMAALTEEGRKELREWSDKKSARDAVTSLMAQLMAKHGGWKLMPSDAKLELSSLFGALVLKEKNNANLGASLTTNEERALLLTLPPDPTAAGTAMLSQMQDPLRAVVAFQRREDRELDQKLMNRYGVTLSSPTSEKAPVNAEAAGAAIRAGVAPQKIVAKYPKTVRRGAQAATVNSAAEEAEARAQGWN